MAESNILGLFATPESYQREQDALEQAQAARYAQLDPLARVSYGAYRAGQQLGRGIGGALGGEDPQLKIISLRNQIGKSIDPNDPESIFGAAQQLMQAGDQQGGMLLAQEARRVQESTATSNLRQAQALHQLMPPKLTGDERYIDSLRNVENKIRQGKTPTGEDLSNANIAAQMLSRPRSFLDQASGQTVTIPATDPSKAFPLTFKQFVGAENQLVVEDGRLISPTSTTATTQIVSGGNLPAGVIQDVAGIDKQLKEIENRAPQLDKFLEKIQNGEVKYNLAQNAWDIAGSVLPPIWGGKEVGKQIDKDEIQRALTARVNSVLNSAKGVQAKDDAQRAKDQIASPSTFLSSERMAGAIKDLQRAEKSLTEELAVEKQTLQSRGQPAKQIQPAPVPAPAPAPVPAPAPAISQTNRPKQWNNYSNEEKISSFQKTNPQASRQQIESYLRSINQLK
jgi:hypothetical protein